MNKRNKVGGLPSLGIMNEITNVFNAIKGSPQVNSPLPFQDQLKQSNNCNTNSNGIVM
jgi:hypothetical protein